VGKRKLQLIAAQRGYRPQLSNEIEYSQRAILEHPRKDEENAMVGVANTNKAGQKAAGVECPGCQGYVQAYSARETGIDRYGLNLRSLLGWCCTCDCGFESVSFWADGEWVIHKYRMRRMSGFGRWKVVADLPEPAPVLIGPGHEYDDNLGLVPTGT
jgi:hypothetical protein